MQHFKHFEKLRTKRDILLWKPNLPGEREHLDYQGKTIKWRSPSTAKTTTEWGNHYSTSRQGKHHSRVKPRRLWKKFRSTSPWTSICINDHRSNNIHRKDFQNSTRRLNQVQISPEENRSHIDTCETNRQEIRPKKTYVSLLQATTWIFKTKARSQNKQPTWSWQKWLPKRRQLENILRS